MYSRLRPVKSSLHFYYIYSIRIWNENTLAVYTEKLKLQTFCTVQWFFNPWEMRHYNNVCKRKKERKEKCTQINSIVLNCYKWISNSKWPAIMINTHYSKGILICKAFTYEAKWSWNPFYLQKIKYKLNVWNAHGQYIIYMRSLYRNF